MITIQRTRRIAASPAAVFAVLADPQSMAAIMPRVQRVELLDRHDDGARIATHMQIWPLGLLRSEGEVRWQAGRTVVFRSHQPVTVEACWTLAPVDGGTDLQAALALDLAPLLGPLAALVPSQRVAAAIIPDLDAALAAIARRAEAHV